jgi:DNA-binding IclR family transcriptional regulator
MKSIRKAMEALRLVSVPPHETTVADVARHLNVNASTASRMLAALRDAELLDQDPVTRRYRPGAFALQLASGFRRMTDVLACVQAEMPALAESTGHTTWAGVLSGAEVVVLRMVNGKAPVRFGVDLGRHLPAHAAAMGKALLALLPDADVKKRCGPALPSQTDSTLRNLKALLADLAVTRNRGYALSDQELFQGIRSVSTTVQGPNGEEPVAISVSYPLFTLDKREEQEIVEQLLLTGQRIGQRIGDPRWLRRPSHSATADSEDRS